MFDVYIILKTFTGIFRHNDIYEKKIEENISNQLSAEMAQARVIEMAHQQEE
jgi:hypothetical protein